MKADRDPPARRGARWPKVPARFTAAALSGHSAIGLAFGALIYLVCLTGAISVFVDELKLAEQPAPAAAPLRPGALGRALAEAVARAPAGGALYVNAPATPRQRLSVQAYGAGGERGWIADAAGRLTPERTPFTDFVTELHMNLTAPRPWGSLLVGLAGAALLSLIFSGVMSHPRMFRDAFRLRLSGSRRLREAELHNRLSVWGLPFHVVVTLTGALFGLANLSAMAVAALAFHGDTGKVYAPLLGATVAPDPRPAPVPDLAALAARAQRQAPGSRPMSFSLQRAGTRGALYSVEVSAPGRLPRGDDFSFDAAGRQLGRGRYATGSLGRQVYSAAAQTHFGVFGGLPVRIAYGVLGLALTYISATGVTIWLARRRDRGRPAPRLERAWAAWTWAAPAALLLAALLSPWLAPPAVFWTVALAPQALAQLWPGAGRRPAIARPEL